jgi:hypothetical protein
LLQGTKAFLIGLHGIHISMFYNIPPITNKCQSANTAYATYITIYLVILLCIIPVLVLIIFGGLTYRNLHQIKGLVRQYTDRQMV